MPPHHHHAAGTGTGTGSTGVGAEAKEGANRMHDRRRHRRAQNMYGSSSSSSAAAAAGTAAASTAARNDKSPAACTSLPLPPGLPDKVRDRIEIEANSASVRRIRNGCVVPAVGCVKDSVGFVRREILNNKNNGSTVSADGAGSYGGSASSAGKSGPSRLSGPTSSSRGNGIRERMQMQRGSSSPGKRRRSAPDAARTHAARTHVGGQQNRDSPSNSLSANSRSLLSDDDDDDDEDTHGTTGSASATSGTDSPSCTSESGAPGPITTTGLSTPVRRGRVASATVSKHNNNSNTNIPHRGAGDGDGDGKYVDADADVNASIERREREERLKGERNWMMTTTTTKTTTKTTMMTATATSPRGVASPDAKMKGRSAAAAVGFSGIQFASYEDEDEDSSGIGSGQEEYVVSNGIGNRDEFHPSNDNTRGDGYDDKNNSNSILDDDNDVQNAMTSSGAAADDDGGNTVENNDDMLDLRLSLFQGDEISRSIMSSGSDPSTNVDGQGSAHEDVTKKMVPVSQLKRTVGELALQDDMIDKLQLELAEIRSDRDGLLEEVMHLRKQQGISARKDEEQGTKLVQQGQIERLMAEMEMLRSEVAEKDDEIQRHESYRQRQNQLHDRNASRQKRQEEEIRRLEAALTLARTARANGTTSRDGRGLFSDDAGDVGDEDDESGSVSTGYTYPQRKQTEMAHSAAAKLRPGLSAADNMVDNLQHRTEVIDLKLQISEYESKLRNSVEELADTRNDLKFERDGREKAEGELAKAREIEKGLRARCEENESLNRSIGPQSFPVDMDEIDAIHGNFEEELNRNNEEIRRLAAENDRYLALLDVAENGLNEAKCQIESLQDENEELRLTKKLIEREIDVSVDQDAVLRSEIEALQQILAETEKEAKVASKNSAATSMKSSPREEALEEELSTLKVQMAKAQEILLGAKEKYESEWTASEKLVRELQEENERMKRQISIAVYATTDSSLSVMNVSLKTQVASLKSRLADQGQQLTELEMKLSEKTELESTLREAITVLKRQVALLRRHDDKGDDLRRADGANDILQDELDGLEGILASVEIDRIEGTITADEVDEIKQELEGRLHKSELARLDAEAELVTAREALQREQADGRNVRQEHAQMNLARLDLEKRLANNVEATELLRSEFANIRQQLHRAGIKIESLPQKQKQQNGKRVTWSMSEQTEAENLIKRSEKVTAGYADEISELKQLLGQVLEQGKKERDAGSKELNEISNDKLLQASSDLRSLIRIRNDMETLSRSIQHNCQAVLRIHQANKELKEGKYVAPNDEIIDELC